MNELSGFIELGKSIGIPGLLFGLLYLFMRLDAAKWDKQRGDEKGKWTTLVDQQRAMTTQILAQHKEERDRDFKHLADQMEFLHGQHATQAAMATTLASVQSLTLEIKKAADMLPTYIRDVHARFDTLIGEKEKRL